MPYGHDGSSIAIMAMAPSMAHGHGGAMAMAAAVWSIHIDKASEPLAPDGCWLLAVGCGLGCWLLAVTIFMFVLP